MSSVSDTVAARHRHRVRWAAYAGLAWAVFQLLATRRTSMEYWAGSVAVNALPVLLLALAGVRGSLIATAALAIYGVYRVVIGVRMVMLMLDSRFAPPVDWWVAPLAVPFAALWIVGGLAAYALHRTRESTRGVEANS
jgi:hypothetical protein